MYFAFTDFKVHTANKVSTLISKVTFFIYCDVLRVSMCVQSPSHKNKRQQQELIAELRRKQVKDSRHVYEGKDGAIEDIITGKTFTDS